MGSRQDIEPIGVSRAERRSGGLVRDKPRPIAWQRATKGSLVHGNVFWGPSAQKGGTEKNSARHRSPETG